MVFFFFTKIYPGKMLKKYYQKENDVGSESKESETLLWSDLKDHEDFSIL